MLFRSRDHPSIFGYRPPPGPQPRCPPLPSPPRPAGLVLPAVGPEPRARAALPALPPPRSPTPGAAPRCPPARPGRGGTPDPGGARGPGRGAAEAGGGGAAGPAAGALGGRPGGAGPGVGPRQRAGAGCGAAGRGRTCAAGPRAGRAGGGGHLPSRRAGEEPRGSGSRRSAARRNGLALPAGDEPGTAPRRRSRAGLSAALGARHRRPRDGRAAVSPGAGDKDRSPAPRGGVAGLPGPRSAPPRPGRPRARLRRAARTGPAGSPQRDGPGAAPRRPPAPHAGSFPARSVPPGGLWWRQRSAGTGGKRDARSRWFLTRCHAWAVFLVVPGVRSVSARRCHACVPCQYAAVARSCPVPAEVRLSRGSGSRI